MCEKIVAMCVGPLYNFKQETKKVLTFSEKVIDYYDLDFEI